MKKESYWQILYIKERWSEINFNGMIQIEECGREIKKLCIKPKSNIKTLFILNTIRYVCS